MTAAVGSGLQAGAAAGLAVAMPLGAIGVMLIATGAERGFAAAFAGALGVATADALYATAAAVGGAAAAGALGDAETWLRWASAGVLVAIAAVGLLSQWNRNTALPPSPAPSSHTFRRFVLLTGVNPLTIALFAALVAGLPALAAAGTAPRIAFVAGVFAASLAWQTLLVAAGALLGARVSPRARTWTIVAGYAVVLLLALRLFLS